MSRANNFSKYGIQIVLITSPLKAQWLLYASVPNTLAGRGSGDKLGIYPSRRMLENSKLKEGGHVQNMNNKNQNYILNIIIFSVLLRDL
jgi:hypothetical protein